VTLLYLNNAASSFPKPECVHKAISESLQKIHISPGRGSSQDDPLWHCRQTLGQLLGVGKPQHIILLPSATHALNAVVGGLMQKGGHAVTSAMEHNSLLRPLHHAQKRFNASVTYVAPNDEGIIEPRSLERSICKNTVLVAVTAASNVTGGIQPVADISRLCARLNVPLLIDCAQYIGNLPFNYDQLPGRNYVAFAGHKAIPGPCGTGGLIVPDDTLPQTIFGGTGIRSEMQEHPGDLPLRHEAGTPNIPGFAGLSAATSYLLSADIHTQAEKRNKMVHELRGHLKRMPNVRLLPLPNGDGRAGIVSFYMNNLPANDAGYILQDVFHIVARSGLHCAPGVHRHFNTFPVGAVRISLGAEENQETVSICADAIGRLSKM
jgi:selenocysteine lyase/cysteine desulfurase